MRKILIPLAVLATAVVAAATGGRGESVDNGPSGLRKGEPQPRL